MSSRESDFAARMSGDTPLMAILTGGVHRYEVTGQDGITRATVPTAFDANGYLKPCALVKQRANVPDGWMDDEEAQRESTIQIVEIWFYQDRGSYAAIEAARARCYTLFKGHAFANSFPLRLANVIEREHDRGALKGASLERQDWQVNSILGG